MSKDKVDLITDVIDLALDFTVNLINIYKKDSISISDINELRAAIRRNPEEYFPNYKKIEEKENKE